MEGAEGRHMVCLMPKKSSCVAQGGIGDERAEDDVGLRRSVMDSWIGKRDNKMRSVIMPIVFYFSLVG